MNELSRWPEENLNRTNTLEKQIKELFIFHMDISRLNVNSELKC